MAQIQPRERGSGPPVIIDCQNSVENPIGLVVTQNRTLKQLSLSEDGKRHIRTEGGYPLPTALSDRVITGLISYQFAVDPGFTSRILQFEVRRLVEDFMFPSEHDHRADGHRLNQVLDQLRRISHTTLVTDSWYDKSKGERIEIHAQYINHLKIIYDGDNNTPKTAEIEWGQDAFNSLRNKYTRSLDSGIYAAVKNGLELRLYRYLDRQLSTKTHQKHRSIQKFAKSKLAMHGRVIDAGGRTASTYIAKRIKSTVEALNGKGFPVRVEIDDSQKDFAISFKRLPPGRKNEVVEIDEPGELICHFRKVVHKAQSQRWRFAQPDRELAQTWIEQYGLEASKWMTEKAADWFEKEQPPHKDQRSRRPKLFRALGPYEDAARGAWEMQQLELAGQRRLPLAESKTVRAPGLPSYDDYIAAMIGQQLRADPEADRQLEEEVQAELQQSPGWSSVGAHMKSKWFEGSLLEKRVKAYNFMSRSDFESMMTEEELEQGLLKRHGLTLQQILASDL